MAEEALRRAKAAGSLSAEGGLRAAEERIEKIRKEAKAARARRVALAKREIPAAATAVAGRASQVHCAAVFLYAGGRARLRDMFACKRLVSCGRDRTLLFVVEAASDLVAIVGVFGVAAEIRAARAAATVVERTNVVAL